MDNLTNISVIRDIFSRHGFSFSKKLGQNFLLNPTVCPRIAELGGAKKGAGIIEIGTGVGVLTNELAKRADRVVAIEIDERLMPVLDETLSEYDNVKIINADIMKLDLKQVIAENFDGCTEVNVCANLPYYITSPVIMLLLEQRLPLSSITVMVQKEAGTRFCADMGTREVGAVTAAVRYYSSPQLLFNVARGSFMPAPNVDSCVIRMDVYKNQPYKAEDEKYFFAVVKAAFSQRRKTLVNAVSSSMSIDKTVVLRTATACGFKDSVRPEEMSMEDFISFSAALKSASQIMAG